MTGKMSALRKSLFAFHAVNENVADERLLARVRALMHHQRTPRRKHFAALHAVDGRGARVLRHCTRTPTNAALAGKKWAFVCTCKEKKKRRKKKKAREEKNENKNVVV